MWDLHVCGALSHISYFDPQAIHQILLANQCLSLPGQVQAGLLMVVALG